MNCAIISGIDIDSKNPGTIRSAQRKLNNITNGQIRSCGGSTGLGGGEGFLASGSTFRPARYSSRVSSSFLSFLAQVHVAYMDRHQMDGPSNWKDNAMEESGRDRSFPGKEVDGHGHARRDHTCSAAVRF